MERVSQNDQITWDRGNPAPFFILAEASKRTSHRTSKRLLLKIYGKVNLMKISLTKGSFAPCGFIQI